MESCWFLSKINAWENIDIISEQILQPFPRNWLETLQAGFQNSSSVLFCYISDGQANFTDLDACYLSFISVTHHMMYWTFYMILWYSLIIHKRKQVPEDLNQLNCYPLWWGFSFKSQNFNAVVTKYFSYLLIMSEKCYTIVDLFVVNIVLPLSTILCESQEWGCFLFEDPYFIVNFTQSQSKPPKGCPWVTYTKFLRSTLIKSTRKLYLTSESQAPHIKWG